MHLLTRYGSFRVSSSGEVTTVCARRRAHLEKLRDRFAALAGAKISSDGRFGYRYRMTVPEPAWSAVTAELAREPQPESYSVSVVLSPAALDRLYSAAFILALIWVNAYICGQAFWIEYTGKMNSMHGFWIAMAKLATVHWYKSYWWPYWYLGMPFEYTYAPLVPGLTAAIAKIAHLSAARAFQMASGGVYCLGPVALYLMARQMTGRRGWSFLAALVYSLSAPSELLLPDAAYSVQHWGDARRLYLCFIWDEVPHQLGLALVSLAILFLARAFEDGRFRDYAWAGVFITLSLTASAFGASALVLFAACLLVTCHAQFFRRNAVRVALCGLLAWLAMCPYLPPSLMRAIRSNSQLFAHSDWNAKSPALLAGVLAAGALLWFVTRRWKRWYLRFFLLLSWFSLAISGLEQKWHLHFIPQAGRYKVELELALVLLLIFTIAPLVDRLPRIVRILLGCALLWPVSQQIASHRTFSELSIRPVDITQTIEYQVARWVEPNLPGWRVTAPGSIAQWMNAFSRVPQFTGGSFPTAPDRTQLALSSDLAMESGAEVPPVWYKAYGVDAVIVAGTDSPEFWQPHPHGHQFDGVFPVIWDQRDTRIYAVPRPARTLAHAIPRAGLVTKEPRDPEDRAQVERYVSAIEAADAAPAAFRWLRDGRARIHADVAAGQVISVQATYHPGWKAHANGRNIPVARDGLGMIVLQPDRPGTYDIELLYGADAEARICRLLSLATLLGVAGTIGWRQYRRREAG